VLEAFMPFASPVTPAVVRLMAPPEALAKMPSALVPVTVPALESTVMPPVPEADALIPFESPVTSAVVRSILPSTTSAALKTS